MPYPWVTHFGEEVFEQVLAVLLCILITVYRVTAMSGSEPARLSEVAHPRKNGWNCPWHPFQITAWFFTAFFTAAHYGFLVFYIPGTWRIFGYVIPGLALLVHVTANVVAATIDPAEPEVRKKFRKGPQERLIFDPSFHEHVIEEQHCNLCNVEVSLNAKHCRICDKCIKDFDHHCKWLNTCVGSRNYRWFLVTLFSALVCAMMFFLYSMALSILFFVDRNSLRYNCNHPGNPTACDPASRVLGAPVPDSVFVTLVALLMVLTAIVTFLTGHLAALHIFLISKGLSTYDYIVMKREKEELAKSDPGNFEKCGFIRKAKLNRVAPTNERSTEGKPDSTNLEVASTASNQSRTWANSKVDIVRPHPASILRRSKAKDDMAAVVTSNGTETVINMEGLQSVPSQPGYSYEPQASYVENDPQDIGILAAMIGSGYDSDDGMPADEDPICSTLVAMVSSNSIEEEVKLQAKTGPTEEQTHKNMLPHGLMLDCNISEPHWYAYKGVKGPKKLLPPISGVVGGPQIFPDLLHYNRRGALPKLEAMY